jgi:hypothetical protein
MAVDTAADPPRRAYHTICATMVRLSMVDISMEIVMRASPMDSEVKSRIIEPAALATNGTRDKTPVDLLCAMAQKTDISREGS